MRLRLIAAPATEPVTLAEATAQVSGFGTANDAILGALIVAAREHLDGRKGILGRALMPQTWELLLDNFPVGVTLGGSEQLRISVTTRDRELRNARYIIEIPLPPLASVTSITYTDTAGVLQTLPTSVYAVDTASEPGVVSLKYGQSWPATRTERNAVTIKFVAGYADSATVPQALKAAMKLHIADLFENRERQGPQVFENAAYDALIFPYRLVRP